MARGRKPETPAEQAFKAANKSVDKSDATKSTIPPKPETIKADPVASREWDRLTKLLDERGTLSQADSGVLLCYCDAFSRLIACRKALAEDGPIASTELGAAKLHPAMTAASVAARDLRAAAADLGATPAARNRVPKEKNSELDELHLFLRS